LPDGTILTPVTVRAADAKNLSVTPVSMQREVFSGQERVVVTGGVVNRSDEAVSNVNVNLELDGRVVQTTQVSVEPNGSASTTFAPVTITTDGTRAAVRIGDDALTADNGFHFVLSPPRPVEVSLVTRGSRDSALYLIRALSIGESPRFVVTLRALDGLTDEVLNHTRVVILDDVNPADNSAGRLKAFVESGGGLFVVQGAQASWQGAAADLLPATSTGVADRSRGAAGTVGALAYGHEVFEPFRAPRSGDFSAARIYGYRTVTPSKDAQVLARFDDGSPALIERPLGQGRVLLWTTTLDLYWNDLALKPVFLPFIHQVVRHLSAYRERPAWSTVGQVLDLAAVPESGAAGRGTQGSTAGRSRFVLTPSAKRVDLEGDQGAVLELAEQGFYEVRAGRQGAAVLVAASNVELAESDRAAVDPKEIVAAVTGTGRAAGAAGETTALPDAAQERSQLMWWYLLFAGILLLTAESLLAHRLSRSA
jgi:hypothetical protein